jgi:hypothetical protein
MNAMAEGKVVVVTFVAPMSNVSKASLELSFVSRFRISTRIYSEHD